MKRCRQDAINQAEYQKGGSVCEWVVEWRCSADNPLEGCNEATRAAFFVYCAKALTEATNKFLQAEGNCRYWLEVCYFCIWGIDGDRKSGPKLHPYAARAQTHKVVKRDMEFSDTQEAQAALKKIRTAWKTEFQWVLKRQKEEGSNCRLTAEEWEEIARSYRKLWPFPHDAPDDLLECPPDLDEWKQRYPEPLDLVEKALAKCFFFYALMF